MVVTHAKWQKIYEPVLRVKSCALAKSNFLQRLFYQCVTSESQPGDGVDNDCDDRIDEEVRDNKDNDGDGKVDEDLALVSIRLDKGILQQS